MPAPWEKYQAAPQAAPTETGPWAKYSGTQTEQPYADNKYFKYDPNAVGPGAIYNQGAARLENYIRKHPAEAAGMAASVVTLPLGLAETAAQRVIYPSLVSGGARFSQGLVNKEPLLSNTISSGIEAAKTGFTNLGGEALMKAPGLLKKAGEFAYENAKPAVSAAATRLGLKEIPAGMLTDNPIVRKLESGLVNSKEFVSDLLGNKPKEAYKILKDKLDEAKGLLTSDKEAALNIGKAAKNKQVLNDIETISSEIPKYVKGGNEEVELGLLSGLKDKAFDLGYRGLTSKPIQATSKFIKDNPAMATLTNELNDFSNTFAGRQALRSIGQYGAKQLRTKTFGE